MFNKYILYFLEEIQTKKKIHFFQFKLFEQPLYVVILNTIINLSNLLPIIVGNEQKKIKVYFNLVDLSELPYVKI